VLFFVEPFTFQQKKDLDFLYKLNEIHIFLNLENTYRWNRLGYSQLPIVVESDCLQMISAVSDCSQDRSPYQHVLLDIKALVKDSRTCNLVKVDRSQVRISHCLANWARAEDRTSLWFGSGPECVLQVLASELIVDPTD
jgi:hypothetical protein